ncbi:DSD1 family PLP-dependent enzyme [Azorhizobium doebereinerae]|uniref:DSD1 family PLP-dependent enzyme n=1 Tax=Azorhizobium doebereinerae TaxID=281091 RepID=UPI00055401E6|nr:DSD1 family PLP-dependent enzyme [Azorhizobium doebereinerae]
MREDEVDTPALILDLDAFEANLDTMAARLAPTGAKLRAHAKTHKSAVIARLQMARGAVGQCVQKVGEAEALAHAGIDDILVSNEVVSPRKLARLAALSPIARVQVCADDPAMVPVLEAAAAAAGIRLSVLVEIEVGARRCGLEPGAPAAELAARIAASKHLAFGGLQAYFGSAQHKRQPEERRAAIAFAGACVERTLEHLRAHHLDCPIVGGGGTGTFAFEAGSGLWTEIQAGSYIFMDADYARNIEPPPFRHSLFVLAQVMSAPAGSGRAVVDAGHKAAPIDSGFPVVFGRPDLAYVGASDEHGVIEARDGALPALGEKLRLIPGHCDPTVDRYDWYVGVRGGRVECLWPVTARGMMA